MGTLGKILANKQGLKRLMKFTKGGDWATCCK
jgi:hypothetical protein